MAGIPESGHIVPEKGFVLFDCSGGLALNNIGAGKLEYLY
jgi:hypothetical protein